MKKIIVANLKMNLASVAETRRLLAAIGKASRRLKAVEAVFCPPFVFLGGLKDGGVKLGAQDVFWEVSGAYTGEISPTMLKKLGVKYVIIGHSERRENLGETDEMVNKKVKAALQVGLKVILCVGEKIREDGVMPPIVKEELTRDLDGITRKLARNLIIAYEPIWAIGTGKTDNPKNLVGIVIYIRRILFDFYGRMAYDMPILYGGSVNEKNAGEFLSAKGVGGLLVGGASLDSKKFIKIMSASSLK